MSDYPTFYEKKEKSESACVDRQNTKWAREIAGNCDHSWKPVSIESVNGMQPDLNNARTYCVCMKCCSHTYIETGWIGYYIGSPDLLEEPD